MITGLLILLSLFFSLYAWTTQDPTLAFTSTALLHGDYYTLLTGIFVHATPLHLAGNMIFLYVFASTLEEEIGPAKTLLAFLTGGVLSFLASIPFYPPGTPMVGASAAIFTLTAIAMLTRPLNFSLIFLMPVGLVALLYFLYNLLALEHGPHGNIAYTAHVIGFLIGLPLGIKWSPQWQRNLKITLILLAVYTMVVRIMVL